jgi:hypothetical protein
LQQRLKVVGEQSSFDPFAGETKGYHRENFYTGARDGAGNSETKYLKISGSILGQIGALVSGRKVPAYKTEADFIRDAIVHRLHDVGVMIEDGTILSTVNRSVKLDRIQQRQVELQEFAAIINQHEESMAQCVQSEDDMLLEELINDAESDYEDLRPNYQARLTVVIDKYKTELKRLREK